LRTDTSPSPRICADGSTSLARTGSELSCKEPNGMYLFNGLKQLKSGTEIYGQDMKAVKKGRRILVIVSRAEGNCEYQGTELPGMFP
jgi:hypothetical protein